MPLLELSVGSWSEARAVIRATLLEPDPARSEWRAWLIDGIRRDLAGKEALLLFRENHPSASLMAEIALNSPYDAPATEAEFRRLTVDTGPDLRIAVHVAAVLLIAVLGLGCLEGVDSQG